MPAPPTLRRSPLAFPTLSLFRQHSPVTKVRCPSVRRQPGHFDLYVLGVNIARLTLFLLPAALAQATVVSISTTSLPNGTVGQHYSAAVKAIHGCTPYRWWIYVRSRGVFSKSISLNFENVSRLHAIPSKEGADSHCGRTQGA